MNEIEFYLATKNSHFLIFLLINIIAIDIKERSKIKTILARTDFK